MILPYFLHCVLLKYYTSHLNQDLFYFNPCFRIIMKYHVEKVTKTVFYALDQKTNKRELHEMYDAA